MRFYWNLCEHFAPVYEIFKKSAFISCFNINGKYRTHQKLLRRNDTQNLQFNLFKFISRYKVYCVYAEGQLCFGSFVFFLILANQN